MIRDAAGYLWISSYEGLNRFDGKSFRNFYNYPRKRNAIHGVETTGLVRDSTQKIWIGSGDGLNRYDPVTDSMMVFFPDKPPAKQSSYIIPVGATAEEIICFDINGMITAYHCKNLSRRIIAHDIPWHSNYISVNNAWLDKEHNILWMPAHNGIAQIDIGNGKTTWHLAAEKVNAVYRYQKGSLLTGTANGLIEYDINTRTARPVAILPAALTGRVNCITADVTGAIWIGTEEHGIFIMQPGKSFVQLQKNNIAQHSISGNKINTIYCDPDGIVWAGVSTNGIDQLKPGNGITHYAEEAGKPGSLTNNVVRCFLQDNQARIWLATQGGGINLFNPVTQQFSALTTKNLPGLPFDFIRYMVRDKHNTAWIGTERGMCRADINNLQATTIHFTGAGNRLLADPYIEQIIPFENNGWLIATKEYGLFRLEALEDTARQLEVPGNKHVFYTAIVNDKLFMSVWDDKPKIYSIKNDNWKEIKNPLSGFIVTYVLFDSSSNRYWIGTLQGLLETDTGLNIMHHYTTDEGLSNHYIYAIIRDRQGFLWMSTNKGLSRFDPHSSSFRIFTPEDGLQGYEYNAKAGFADAAGNLYFGGTNGFDIIRRDVVVHPPPAAHFYISELLVNNISYAGDRDINYTSSLSLPYTSNNITIQTGVVDFMTMGKNRIRYKLVGLDTGWKYADRDFRINYSGLVPGNYTFIASASGNNNVWSDTTAKLTITITAPWWRSWWLRGAVVLGLLGIAFVWLRSYYAGKLEKQRLTLEKQKAIELERTRIATDMHDDLGAALSRIKFLSETIGIQEQRQQPVTNEINRIKMYADEMIDKMGEIVWALNEKNDTLDDLVAYTRSYAVNYLSQHGIDCTARFPANTPGMFVSGEFRRNVFLAVKEGLHNVIKHSKATEVILSLAVTDKLFIEIKDNGTGFNADTVRPYSNGLTNIRTRMKNIGGNAVIRTDNGVQLQLMIPLPV